MIEITDIKYDKSIYRLKKINLRYTIKKKNFLYHLCKNKEGIYLVTFYFRNKKNKVKGKTSFYLQKEFYRKNCMI